MRSIRSVLNEATRPLHDEVDRRASRFDCARPEGVAGLLAFLARGIHTVEARLDSLEAERVWPPYRTRRRAHLLPQVPPAPLPAIRTDRHVMGALYVLEGSRTGARLMVKRAPHLARHPFFQPEPSVVWKSFVAALESVGDEHEDLTQLVDGALSAFHSFLERQPGSADDSGKILGVV